MENTYTVKPVDGGKFVIVGPHSNPDHKLGTEALAEYVASAMNIAFLCGCMHGVNEFQKRLQVSFGPR